MHIIFELTETTVMYSDRWDVDILYHTLNKQNINDNQRPCNKFNILTKIKIYLF